MRVAPAIELMQEQTGELTRLVRSRRTSVRLAQRALIVLLAAQGLQNKDIAGQLGIGRVQVARWRQRYLESGIPGIERDLPRGAPPVKVDIAKLVALTTQGKPEAATHWSTRKMAAVLQVSPSTVMRHWQANGLKPHLVRGFKVSRDPKFAQKLEDIVGLYMSPPEHALVLCCDEIDEINGWTYIMSNFQHAGKWDAIHNAVKERLEPLIRANYRDRFGAAVGYLTGTPEQPRLG